MTQEPPTHHIRYARAWNLFQDDSLSQEARDSLMSEMDSAQNYFGWQEFQDFKVTLPGFVEFWDGWAKSARLQIQALKL